MKIYVKGLPNKLSSIREDCPVSLGFSGVPLPGFRAAYTEPTDRSNKPNFIRVWIRSTNPGALSTTDGYAFATRKAARDWYPPTSWGSNTKTWSIWVEEEQPKMRPGPKEVEAKAEDKVEAQEEPVYTATVYGKQCQNVQLLCTFQEGSGNLRTVVAASIVQKKYGFKVTGYSAFGDTAEGDGIETTRVRNVSLPTVIRFAVISFTYRSQGAGNIKITEPGEAPPKVSLEWPEGLHETVVSK